MTDLLETVIQVHGGLERWNQLNSVSAHLIQGGALWALKGQDGVLDDVVVTASLHEEQASHDRCQHAWTSEPGACDERPQGYSLSHRSESGD